MAFAVALWFAVGDPAGVVLNFVVGGEMSGITAHIRLDEDGVARIDETRIKVIEVAIDKIANGSSPEEMHFQ
jgi:hypothetical protein